MFEIGDRVLLYNYSKHGDWSRHIDQTATITALVNKDYKWEITWDDGDTSHVNEDNLLLIKTDETELEKVIRRETTKLRRGE